MILDVQTSWTCSGFVGAFLDLDLSRLSFLAWKYKRSRNTAQNKFAEFQSSRGSDSCGAAHFQHQISESGVSWRFGRIDILCALDFDPPKFLDDQLSPDSSAKDSKFQAGLFHVKKAAVNVKKWISWQELPWDLRRFWLALRFFESVYSPMPLRILIFIDFPHFGRHGKIPPPPKNGDARCYLPHLGGCQYHHTATETHLLRWRDPFFFFVASRHKCSSENWLPGHLLIGFRRDSWDFTDSTW